MKNIFLICSLVVSQLALADRAPIGPGPILDMGDEAAKVARILLNRQLSKCVADFQKEDVAITGMTSQKLAPGRARYQVEGVVLEGGDMATGQIVLSIDETEEDGFGFGKVKVYSCSVTKK